MSTENTTQALAAITDEGLFERLATAVLREVNPNYSSLVHTGVNVEGKTVKSPVDGICFIPGSVPPHMIAVHHTITTRADLKKKWLHDPSKVKPRKVGQPTAPAGDLIKAAELVANEIQRTTTLRATLVLTTNEEPDEALVREVEAVGRVHGFEVDLWPRSRICHFLDTHPAGQCIRRSFLNIEQELLSSELFHALSKKSLDIHSLPDNPVAWVPRALDTTLTAKLPGNVTFLVAGSGLGKSVACYRKLKLHVENGGFGIVLPHEMVAAAMTLEEAVATTLRQLYPSLAAMGASALAFCSAGRPLILIVEDINRSGQSQRLAEKIASWNPASKNDDNSASPNWCLICPLWPEVLASLSEQARKRIEPLVLVASTFTDSEGRDAVLARARLDSRDLSPLAAEAISRALGHDPLLIALHDPGTAPDPHQTIRQFIERSLARAAAATADHPAADYRQALRKLSGEMLTNGQLELSWLEVTGWAGLQGEPLRLLSCLAHQGELIRLTGLSDEQRLAFRHDRVRDRLLADAAAELDRRGLLAEDTVADPFLQKCWALSSPGDNPRSPFYRVSRLLTRSPFFTPFASSVNPPRYSMKPFFKR